jgi:hypothetical protein
MKSPLIAYKEEKDKSKRRKETALYFNEKYFRKPFEDEFLETSERILARKLNFFLPGRIYTWVYDPIGAKSMPYYDKMPLVLVHGQYVSGNKNKVVQGLNLNMFPEYTKVEILENFYKVFERDIYRAEEAIDKNQLGSLNRVWQYMTNSNFVYTLFNEKADIGYQWGVRNYIIPRIKSAILVELEDWEKIPYYIPKEIEGAGLASIWSDYLTNKKNLTEYNVDGDKASQQRKKYIPPGGG